MLISSVEAGSSQRVPIVARRQRQTQQTQRLKEPLSAVPSAATLEMVSETVIRCRPRLRNKPLQTPAGEPGVSAACSQGWLRPGRLWGVDEQVKACSLDSLSSTRLLSGDLTGPFGESIAHCFLAMLTRRRGFFFSDFYPRVSGHHSPL